MLFQVMSGFIRIWLVRSGISLYARLHQDGSVSIRFCQV